MYDNKSFKAYQHHYTPKTNKQEKENTMLPKENKNKN